jgi:hypothetical protein
MRRWQAVFVLVTSLALAACPAGGDHTGSESNSTGDDAFKACGGDPEGTWKPVRVELDDPDGFISQTFAGESACKGVDGDVQLDPSGRYVFGSDHSYTIDLSLDVDMDVTLDQACLQALTGSTAAADDAACAMLEQVLKAQLDLRKAACSAQDDACACALSTTVDNGAIETTYEVKGDQLVVTTDSGELRPSPFCVAGDRLEIKVDSGALAGLVVLER